MHAWSSRESFVREGLSVDLARAIEPNRPDRPAGLEAHDVPREHSLRTETNGPSHRAVGEVRPRKSLGEPEEIFDRRALTRLAPGASRSTPPVRNPSDAG